jgi:hypothetical protein
MIVIRELVEEVQCITEASEDGPKKYFLEGIFMQGGIQNRNKRIYPVNVLESAVSRYQKDYIEQKRAYGELGHPDKPNINLDRISHIITEIKQDGNNFIGKAKVMDTPMGKIVKNIIDEGGRLGISSRALGALKETKQGMEVQEGLYISTAGDIVHDPSAPDAWLNAVMEGREWVLENGVWREHHHEQVVEEVKKMSNRQREREAFRLFERFLYTITNNK